MNHSRFDVRESVSEQIGNVALKECGVGHVGIRHGGGVEQGRLNLIGLDERDEARKQYSLRFEACVELANSCSAAQDLPDLWSVSVRTKNTSPSIGSRYCW
jgi:hypothetical protein